MELSDYLTRLLRGRVEVTLHTYVMSITGAIHTKGWIPNLHQMGIEDHAAKVYCAVIKNAIKALTEYLQIRKSLLPYGFTLEARG